ncbi:MAG: response regulator [Candidatus Zambryskibacteria bacterium]|nr:response regulator [Candidatus Zambryskibacteria bacterium]
MTNEEKKYKIILVDDDDFLVNMYVTKFNNSGVEVEACNSGTSFIEKLKSGLQADLILLDIVMSDMSGIEALKKMRKEKLGEGIPIVMLTNQNNEEDINISKELGVAAYIIKSAATPLEVVEETMRIIKNSKN